jgi:addiction module HigA family antidote
LNEYKPDTVSPPCETLQDLLDAHQLNPAKFAAQSGLSIELGSDLLSNKTSITLEVAAVLAKMFNMSAQFWINRQQEYDLWVKQNAANS